MTGMLAPDLAIEIAQALQPLIDRQVERQVAQQVVRMMTPERSRDEKIMAACRAVAEATDRLAAVRYTAEERPARIAVERAARRLAKVMRSAR